MDWGGFSLLQTHLMTTYKVSQYGLLCHIKGSKNPICVVKLVSYSHVHGFLFFLLSPSAIIYLESRIYSIYLILIKYVCIHMCIYLLSVYIFLTFLF